MALVIAKDLPEFSCHSATRTGFTYLNLASFWHKMITLIWQLQVSDNSTAQLVRPGFIQHHNDLFLVVYVCLNFQLRE